MNLYQNNAWAYCIIPLVFFFPCRFYNFRAISDRGNKYQFLFEDDESHTLIVNDLGILDAGEYSVAASNKLGKAESAYKIKSGELQLILTESIVINKNTSFY